MSGRGGGRGGRGGGRGGGRQPPKPSLSKELLKRSAAEAGLDDRHLKVLSDITRPPLYPDFLWHSTGKYWDIGGTEEVSKELSIIKRPASTVFIMNKQRELTERYQNSTHYVKPTATTDVIRYSQFKQMMMMNSSNNAVDELSPPNQFTAPDKAVLASMGKTNKKLATDERYFPTELLFQKKKKKKKTIKKLIDDDLATTIVKLEEELISSSNIVNVATEQKDNNNNNEDDDEVEELEEQPDEMEEMEDYTTNYYESEGEEGGGDDDDDGEPTF